MIYFYIYLILINIVAIIITCYDKRCAIKNKWRTKEKTLFVIALLGGSVAMYLTMRIIRHKTKHFKFMFGIPLIFLAQAIAYFLVITYVW